MKNEPAFPSKEYKIEYVKDLISPTGDRKETKNIYHNGMTLRDFFAAKAMQGMISNKEGNNESRAEWAYKQADALLAEREGK